MVKSRLLNVIDLVAAERRYHFECYRDFSRSSLSQKGRPKSQSLSVAFAQVHDKIEESDECQYTIKEIQEMLQQISGEESVYTEKPVSYTHLDVYKRQLRFSAHWSVSRFLYQLCIILYALSDKQKSFFLPVMFDTIILSPKYSCRRVFKCFLV